MCLSELWSHKKLLAVRRQSQRAPIKAYKVVSVRDRRNWHKDGKLHGNMMNCTFQTGYKWQTGHNRRRYALSAIMQPKPKRGKEYREYPAGFHAYASLDTANKNGNSDYLRVVPCLLWDIVAVGKQDGGKVYVARKMMLLC